MNSLMGKGDSIMTLPGYTAEFALGHASEHYCSALEQRLREVRQLTLATGYTSIFPIRNPCWFYCFRDPTGYFHCQWYCLGG